MKNIFDLLMCLDKFQQHQDVTELKNQIAALEDLPVRPKLYNFSVQNIRQGTILFTMH